MFRDLDRGSRLAAWTAVACSLALFLPLLYPLVTGRVFRFDDLGHYPQIEDPRVVSDVLRRALDA